MSYNVIFETNLHELVFELSTGGYGAGIVSGMFFAREKPDLDAKEPYYILPIKNDVKPLQPCLMVKKGMNSTYVSDLTAIISSVILAGAPKARQRISRHNEAVDKLVL